MNCHKTTIATLLLTSAFLLGSATVHAQPARLSVTGDLKKHAESEKNEGDTSSSKTTTEYQKYELAATVINPGPDAGSFDLEWYFFRRPLDSSGEKGDPVLCEKGKTTLSIPGTKRVVHKVISEELTNTETKTSKNSSNNNNNSNSTSSTSSKTISGSVPGGYIMLVRSNGEIVATYSPDRKMLTEEWMAKLNDPVNQGSSKPGKATTKKKAK